MGEVWREEKTIDVGHPPERVFDYLSRWHLVGEWDRSVVAAHKRSPGTPAVGSRYELRLRFGWQTVPMTYTITAMNRPHRLELSGRGRQFQVLDRIRIGATPTGTRLTYTVEVGFDRPFNPVVHRIGAHVFKRSAEKAIRRLRTMLCGAAQPPALTALTRMADQAIVPGLIGFTRIGHRMGRCRRPVASGLYTGRTILLTGGTSGIGRAAARAFLRKGAHLVVVGRDADKLNNLRGELASIRDAGTIDTQLADLSLMSDVRQLAERLNRRCGRIDVLINNAGGLFTNYGRTAEGIERTMATDLVSPYLLTRLLLPSLKAAGSARIVNVASGGMYTQAMRADMLDVGPIEYDGATTYARAKRGLVMLAGHWARELAPWGITVHAMHPGWVDTPGLARSLPAFHRQLAPLLRTPEQGADTIVWLAAAPDAARASGHFWLDRKIRATHVFPHTRGTAADAAALVKALDRMCQTASIG